MRTNLVFKFFIIFFCCLVFGLSSQAYGFNFFAAQSAALTDTIELPEVFTEPEVLNDTLPSEEDFLPQLQDTLIGNDFILTENDTLAIEPERQTGAGFILDTRVEYSAVDSIDYDIKNQRVYLYGDAEMDYGSINLTAAFILIDFSRKELFAQGMPDSLGVLQGNPVFVEGIQSFESKELRYNFETRRGRTTQVITEEADGFMHGDVVKMMEDRVVHVSSGKYTTCDNPEPHFHISFNRAKIIPNDKIISSFAFLTIEGVRTPLIMPFGFFPNKRGQASGILIPSYGEARNRGFYLENGGFYWGINDYVDLSLRGDIYSRGSWAARVGSNYRVRYRYSGSLNLNYAINILGERDLPGYERNRDFRVQWSHNQDPKARPNSVFRASVNAGSSSYNRFNPTTTSDYLSNTFSSNISYSASWAGRYNLSVNARHSQNTLTEMVDLSLPEIAFSAARFYPFRRREPEGRLRWYEEITMNYNMNASNQIRVSEADMFTSAMFQDMKNGVQHTIPLSHSFRVLRHFNLSNSISYNERWYFQQVRQNWEFDPEGTPTTTNPIPGNLVRDTIPGFFAVRDFNYSTSMSTRLFGLMQFRRGPVTALRHVISPSLSFSYRPDFADPFWGYYAFYDNPNQERPVRYSYYENFRYGVPAAGRSGSISLGIGNNLEMKVRSRRDTVSGERKIALIDNFNVSGSYNLAADSLNMSDIRVSGRTRLFGQFDISYSSSWSPYAADSMGRPYNRFLWEEDRKLLQLRNTSWSLNFNYTLSSKNGRSGSQTGVTPGRDTPVHGMPTDQGNDFTGNGMQPEMTPQETGPLPPGFIDYSVPWSLRFSYNFSYNSVIDRRTLETDRRYLQNLNFSGDINLTPNWRIGFSSGYNFDEKQITYTSIDIYRDLHCWEMLINWVPFGFRQSYNLTIRVKSSVLQDLKLSRRTHHLDRAFQ
ncbi:MAG: LPS-assembly protein LptD [Bacteroidetes bacterium]|nr:MAG: LPS-assembly protein LptD [Bacteroidota bacterium]